MKPVDQIKLHSDTVVGDCFRACLASILEVSPETIPHFVEEDGDLWYPAAQGWCETHGLELSYRFKGSGIQNPPAGYWIAAGKSPRGEFTHAVVFFGGKMIHDPHPSKDGIVGPPLYCYFVE